MTRRRAVSRGVRPCRVLAIALFVVPLAPGCTIAPAPAADRPEPTADDQLPPPGYGTLLQDDVTISLVSRGLEVKVTPLAESVIRVTAPDTYARLSGIARANREEAPPDSRLFLVSFYSTEPGMSFLPDEVQLISRGLRARPSRILPVTPSWGQHQVDQRRAEMAVYAFGPQVDLEAELTLVYGFDETTAWNSILARVQVERGRARARAGNRN